MLYLSTHRVTLILKQEKLKIGGYLFSTLTGLPAEAKLKGSVMPYKAR